MHGREAALLEARAIGSTVYSSAIGVRHSKHRIVELFQPFEKPMTAQSAG